MSKFQTIKISKMKTHKDGNQLILKVANDKREFISDQAFTPIEIRETEEAYDDEFGCIRLFSNYIGDSVENENHFTLQIRANQSLKRGNKKKNIIASVSLSDSEIMALAKYVKEKRKTFNTYIKDDCK